MIVNYDPKTLIVQATDLTLKLFAVPLVEKKKKFYTLRLVRPRSTGRFSPQRFRRIQKKSTSR